MLQVTLPGYCFLHDLGITCSHYVIFQNPVSLRMLPLLLGTLCPAHSIRWTGKPPKIHLLPRPATASESPAMPLHHAEEKKQQQGLHPSVQLVATSGSALRALEPQRQAIQASKATHNEGKGQEANPSDAFLLRGDSSGKHGDSGGHCIDLHVLASDSQAATAANISEGAAQALHLSAKDGDCCGQQTVHSQEAAFVFHQANSYESEDGRTVVVDCIRYPSMPDFEQVQQH